MPSYTQHSIEFYWYDQGEYQVTANVTLRGGRGIGLIARYKVLRPQIEFEAEQGVIREDATSNPFAEIVSLGSSAAGEQSGIRFTADVTGRTGTISWIQIVDLFSARVYYSNASPYVGDPNNPLNLGGGYEYVAVESGLDTLKVEGGYDPGISFGPEWEDSPEITLPKFAGYGHVEIEERFTTYLMWQSNERKSKPVPLGKISWKWNVVADGNEVGNITQWDVDYGLSDWSKTDFSHTSVYPVWTRRVLWDQITWTPLE